MDRHRTVAFGPRKADRGAGPDQKVREPREGERKGEPASMEASPAVEERSDEAPMGAAG